MSSNLFKNIVIEMAGVAEHLPSDVICVSQPLVYLILKRELGPLAELGLALGRRQVDVLHPAVMNAGSMVGDVLLEHDKVGVWHFYGVHRRQDRSGIVMDCVHDDRRPSRQQWQQREAEEPLHNDGAVGAIDAKGDARSMDVDE